MLAAIGIDHWAPARCPFPDLSMESAQALPLSGASAWRTARNQRHQGAPGFKKRTFTKVTWLLE